MNKSSSGVDLLTDVSGDSAVIEVSNSGEAKDESPASSSFIYSPAQSLTETGKKYSAITSFLTLPSKLQERKGKTKSPALARVLTSEESLAMLKEKEGKKKQEEKQKRKKEREKKRQEKLNVCIFRKMSTRCVQEIMNMIYLLMALSMDPVYFM